MKLRPIAAITLRQLYLMRISPVRILPMVSWVAIDMIVWGFMSRYLNSVTGSGINFISTLLGAVLFWDLFTRIMQGVTLAFFEDVWSRNFVNVFATPLLISEYLSGLIVTATGTSLLGLIVMLVMATTLFGLPFCSLGLLLIPFKRDGAALRSRLRVARVADPGDALAIRRRFLSAFCVAGLDARRRIRAATGLCIRKHARDRGRTQL
jgi:hypothetical protein